MRLTPVYYIVFMLYNWRAGLPERTRWEEVDQPASSCVRVFVPLFILFNPYFTLAGSYVEMIVLAIIDSCPPPTHFTVWRCNIDSDACDRHASHEKY